MEKINSNQVEPIGMPIYEMKKLFTRQGDFKEVSMSVISLTPGERVPAVGMSCHEEDEYSYIFSGEIDTYSKGVHSVEKAGDATFIPAGEEHWCINRTNEPCLLVCFMVKKAEA
ncbi:cupin [Bacillus sp. AFS001701]|uniref:cupin domain-containing protein n=1 Tax=Bacillaceae TaxID=186817 RepID=UPI000BF985B4|nr:cupin domain-containing protein [Bacillus sp. AFS001701]PET65564.1 cupin [Bacillus sp. AFS001701]